MSRYVRRCLDWYSSISPKKPLKVPYGHITQIGDPILRKKCEPVPDISITSNEIRKIINTLKMVRRNHDCVGLSAPQIGVNKRIFIMELTEKQLKSYTEKEIREMEIITLPLLVFINPTMKIIDLKQVSHIEACGSIIGFCAEVPRYKEVNINGYTNEGEEVSITFSGWSARIAQHEMDHLDGKVYTDIMDRKSFSCTLWQEVNINHGKLMLPFTPDT